MYDETVYRATHAELSPAALRLLVAQTPYLDRLSHLGDHELAELGHRYGRRRLAAEAWP